MASSRSGAGGSAPLPANGPAANVSAARRHVGPLRNRALDYLIHGIPGGMALAVLRQLGITTGAGPGEKGNNK